MELFYVYNSTSIKWKYVSVAYVLWRKGEASFLILCLYSLLLGSSSSPSRSVWCRAVPAAFFSVVIACRRLLRSQQSQWANWTWAVNVKALYKPLRCSQCSLLSSVNRWPSQDSDAWQDQSHPHSVCSSNLFMCGRHEELRSLCDMYPCRGISLRWHENTFF